jgi:hypothetical protein
MVSAKVSELYDLQSKLSLNETKLEKLFNEWAELEAKL